MIKRLLVANRGEIARRIFATCRAIGIDTVAVYSDADVDCPHVHEADYAVHLPGNAPSATYLRGDLLIAAARKAGADAIHPGCGSLAESADFAQAVLDAGLTWIGPDPKIIARMTDKLAAKRLVGDIGVPVLPTWAEPEQISGWPVLVRAAAGRGGRGIRLVRDAEGLAEAVASVRREASAVFGDGTVFCEPYIEGARHIEVPVLADATGTVIAFGEYEGSIQRRYQKIIAETPSPAISPALREELCSAAAAVVRAAGHTGAGTVEFLLTAADNRRLAGPAQVPAHEDFYFLELNPRLPVEHAVTECVFGIDLVRMQLLIAEGQPLPMTGPPPMRGHAMEVRLFAEDPAYAWLPSTGTLHRFTVPEVLGSFRPLPQPGLRVDSGVACGRAQPEPGFGGGEHGQHSPAATVVGVHYDPMLAKVIAWAPTRVEAAKLLAGALARASIHGVVTNRDLLVRILRHPAFLDGSSDIGFLDRHPEVFAPLVSAMDTGKLSCLAAALAAGAGRAGRFSAHWRNVPTLAQVIGYEGPSGPVEVGYRFDRTGALAAWSVRATPAEFAGVPSMARDSPRADDHPPVAVVSTAPDRVSLDVNGVRMDFAVHRVAEVSYVDSPDGLVTLAELPRFPLPVPEPADGSLVAPLPGAVGRVLVVPGQRVSAGDLLLTLEALTLEHPVYAPGSGVVAEVPVQVGSQVATGAVLAVITPA